MSPTNEDVTTCHLMDELEEKEDPTFGIKRSGMFPPSTKRKPHQRIPKYPIYQEQIWSRNTRKSLGGPRLGGKTRVARMTCIPIKCRVVHMVKTVGWRVIDSSLNLIGCGCARMREEVAPDVIGAVILCKSPALREAKYDIEARGLFVREKQDAHGRVVESSMDMHTREPFCPPSPPIMGR